MVIATVTTRGARAKMKYEAASSRGIRKRIIGAMHFAPVAVALAIAVASIAGCGHTYFAGTSVSTPTATASPGTGAFLYASNYQDAKIAEFTRNTSTGALTLKGTIAAGAAQGPKGMAIDPSNSYLYAANFADGKVYEYSIGSGGTLTAIGDIASGAGPEAVAIDSSGQYVYVSNFGGGVAGSIYEYSIGSSGTLTSIGSVTGPSGPIGIAIGPNDSYLYVADNAGGYIWTYAINSNGTLVQPGTAIPSLGLAGRGTPGFLAIAADSTATYLFATDVGLGAVSEYAIGTGGTPVYGSRFSTGNTSNQPLGIGLGYNGVNYYLFTANSAGNSASSFSRSGGNLTLLNQLGGLSGPTGLAVDPQGQYVYTGNSGDGTVAQMRINGACGQALCLVKSFNTESPANRSAGTQFVVMTN